MGENLNYSAKLGEEIRRLEEAGMRCSAELLVKGVEPTQGSSSSEAPPKDSVTAADGHWIGSRGVLTAENEAESLAQELRQRAAGAPDSADSKAELLQAWIATEPFLSQAELDELRPAVLAQIFGGQEDYVTLSRNSDGAQGGGY
ncbi:hypothetical protein [Streptomyces zaehneri]|uniref:hypothetical protein n=1 Tax=Streptomyces zaehneri TaxID=3051180 RepID=UPI0028D1E007|nr:hypothetical protein [Streptomyces sp. DSM 40713]